MLCPDEGMSSAITTDRLILRRPTAGDTEAIFQRYASDPQVTHYLAWPRHRTLDDTRGFLAFSDSEWRRWPAGPFLAISQRDGSLLGSTGLAFETPRTATTGYVLARQAWGQGYATECLLAMVTLARRLGIEHLSAHCHVEHVMSHRVLEKGGFECHGRVPRHSIFPNLDADTPLDVLTYSLELTPTPPDTI